MLDSDTYNQGKTFVAPLPLAAWAFRSATLNFVYIPKASDVNPGSEPELRIRVHG